MAIDESQLTACYRRLERPLYNALYRLLWEPQACMDALHDGCLGVWAQRRTVDPERIDALVTAAALNAAKNRLRWQSIRQWLPWEDRTLPESAGQDSALEHATAAQLREAIDSLPWRDREVLVLAEFMGLSTAEIAQTLGIPDGTVGSRRHNAMQRLSRTLRPTVETRDDR